jgi:hypothetical protein
LIPRVSSVKPAFSNIYHYARQRPALAYHYARQRPALALTSAATAAVVGAGLGVGLSVGSSPSASAASGAPISHVSVAHAADQARQIASGASHVTAAPHALPAQAVKHASVSAREVSQGQRPAAASSHPTASASAAHSASAVRPARAAHSATAHHAVRHAHRAWDKPFLIYDSTTPTAIPGRHLVATYATGPFAVPASQVAGRSVMWIDTNGSDPNANALDIEPGDATPTMAATWTSEKLSADPHTDAVLYTMQSEWPAVQAAVGTLPHWMQEHVRWWIADPTGYPHVLPGANATQWYWGQNYDITTANPGF